MEAQKEYRFDFKLKTNKLNIGGIKNKNEISDLNNEVWKPINNYPNYLISNKGRIKNISLNYLMSIGKDEDGYGIIGLRNNGKRTTKRVHKLVAEAFIPNPNNYTIVHHKDHNRLNNNVDNLEWTTIKNNVINANKNLSSLAKTIIYIDVFNNIKKFESVAECASYFKVTRSAIRYRLKHTDVIRIKNDYLKGGTLMYE